MSEQEGELNTAEQTVETTPPVVEEQAISAAETSPAGESTEPDKTNEIVQKRVNELNDKYRSDGYVYQEALKRGFIAQQQSDPTPELDPDSQKAVQAQARMVYEQQEQARFETKHAKDFVGDPLLKASYLLEVNESMAKGQYIDREAALENAKSTLEARLKPATEAAKKEGVEEGRDIAKTKQQLGAVGETGKQPEVNPDTLSSAELAKHYNIPRVN
jgi:hypothetical protein